MDGPPALTLGLESANSSLLKRKPISKSQGIVSGKMLARILFNGIYVGAIMLLEYCTDFLRVGGGQMRGVIFTLFIFFQLFNAFNSRELGAESIFKGIGKNKIMVLTFLSVLVLHVFIVQVFSTLFGITALTISSYIKCALLSSTIVVVSEIYKFIYRVIKKDKSILIKKQTEYA